MAAGVPWWRRVELPTWILALAIPLAFGVLTWSFHELPLALTIPLGAWLVAWQGSLQHEAIHGHPTRSPRLNAVIVGPPLWLWLPFGIYRESHLAHHSAEDLTCPVEDSESFWVDETEWERSCRVRRALHWIHATFLGRLLLGPIVMLARFLAAELGRLSRGDTSHLRHWAWHLVSLFALLTWVVWVCEIPFWVYVVGLVYPGIALSLVRSFAEHRPAVDRAHRTAVVEAGPLLSLLFLHNNLHALHHRRPHLPWFDYPREYRQRRAELVRDNGGYLHSGYLEIFWRYAFRPRRSPRYSEALMQSRGGK